MVFFLRKSCISSVAARVTGNSPSAPTSPTEEVDRWKVCAWSYSVFLATPHHGPLRPEGHGDLQGGLRDERSIKSHHIYVPNGLRPPFFALYYPHYRHIFVYPFFNSMPGRGSVSTVEERRQCITIVYDDLLWNALMVERASKQHDHVHTFHR